MRLRDVAKTLYHDTRKTSYDREPTFRPVEARDLKDDWDTPVSDKRSFPLLRYITIGAFLFFLLSILFAVLLQLVGVDRSVSSDKVSLVTQGVTSTSSGVVQTFSVRVANRNPVALREATLSVIYPEGSYQEKNGEVRRAYREEFSIGEMQSGSVIPVDFIVAFYGKSGEEKQVRYALEYRVADSLQRVRVTDSYTVVLSDSPVVLGKPQSTSPVAGKEVTFTIPLRVASSTDLSSLYLQLTYPLGFTPTSFSLRPFDASSALWRIQQLPGGSERSVSVTGILRGEISDEQSIVAKVLAAPTGSLKDSFTIAEEGKILSIERSFLETELSFGRSPGDRISTVSPGEKIEGFITWRVADPSPLNDVRISLSLEGSGLNESSINVKSGGYFDEINRELVWDFQNIPSLVSVRSGATGVFRFSFSALPDRIEFAQAKKSIRAAVSATGYRVVTDQVESLRAISVAEISLRSVLQVVGSTLHSSGSIPNVGPIPPRVGEQTYYSLQYFVKNSGNEVADFLLEIPFTRTTRFNYVISGVRPGEWRYDEKRHTLTVQFPLLAAVGAQTSRLFEFQVSVVPVSRDVGTVLALTQGGEYRARDTYVGELFEAQLTPLTTEIFSEAVPYRSGVVVE